MRNKRQRLFVLLLAALLALAGCGGSSSTGIFGDAQNHLHDMLALRGVPHVVLVASHVGLFRTADDGAHWARVAGGPGQPVDGLMSFRLAQSPVDAKRIYLLAVSRPDGPQAAHPVPGIYTSADGGQTWTLAAPLSALNAPQPTTIGAGSTGAGEIFALIAAGNLLLRSDDGGAHWQAHPTPADPHGVMGDPAHPHRVLLWSITGGVSVSNDDGVTWQASAGIKDGIYTLAVAGPRIYAAGNDGIFVSTDDGASFTLIAPGEISTVLSASPADPMLVYGLTGTSVIRSTDGGKTWSAAGALPQHIGLLATSPDDARMVFAGSSYPIGVARTQDGGTTWSAVLP